MRKYEVVEYEESDYEKVDESIKEMSNKELSEMARRVIDGHFVPSYKYGSSDEDDFLNYKEAKIISEALNRLKGCN